MTEHDFGTLMIWAALRARTARIVVHVFDDEDGEPMASEFIPVGKQCEQWIKVLPDGSIVNAHTRKIIGTHRDLLPKKEPLP